MFAQVYEEDNRHVIFKEKVDHRTNESEIKTK